MVRKKRNELLADHAGRAQDADGNLRHIFPSIQKADAVKPCRQLVVSLDLGCDYSSSTTPPTRMARFRVHFRVSVFVQSFMSVVSAAVLFGPAEPRV